MFSYSRVPLFDHNVLQVLPLHGNNLRPNSCHGNPNFQLAINPAFWTPRTGPPQYQYEAYAGFHVVHLHTDGAPLLLFSAPSDVPMTSPRELCEAGNLGNLEANVMAGRALLGVLQLPDTQHRCVILLVHEKVMSSGTSKNSAQRAIKRIAPKLLEVVIVSLPICSDLLWAALGPISQNNGLL